MKTLRALTVLTLVFSAGLTHAATPAEER
ncbi:MAG: hypothetical protein JWO56_1789, partial [Acidobacteria bacterium]|nr:hypothetical protein [Acidobacteriota bacterium]